MNRRQVLAGLSAAAGAGLVPQRALATTSKPSASFKYCLNMSTLRGHKLGFMKEIEVASKAGYPSVEIWINSLEDYLKNGGTLAEARRHLKDSGVQVEDAIGFAQWIVNDDSVRTKALDQLKREMDMLAEVGCKRIAAPPMGATQGEYLDLRAAAERYRAILELGDQTGVVPHLELWGFSKNLSTLGEILFVATQSGHPSARLLMDVYHLYKGGSGLESVAWVGKPYIEVFHVNDYPATPARDKIVDADRVYMGDGVAPFGPLLKTLKNPERPVILSLEVFNPTYYAQDALLVAKTGLAKMKKVTEGI
ncbi:sugar phosphate isomerase/epimerase [Rhabdobacter roseus]|uniref:Sugar phosphate isomerase/epimerase n=1 Tax=Rhabdobacter roseus TaxID=1655419 RepID=A0A840TVM2_9BACT|nr:sugar phosphate isomerase/epimerase family protein [Rhabdobacter roseus]MBB5286955.1 sugar phosphate isomerase/epimerase [Rhabdobacter roseus]